MGRTAPCLWTTLVPLELDHVLIAVADLTEAARELEARHGLGSVEGGRHPGWGTANRIVPLGGAYLELVAVVDPAEAAESPFGRWVARAGPARARPLGWAVRTERLDDVAARLGLAVAAGSRVTRSGRLLRWRMAGLVPFFIEWGERAPFPGRAPVSRGAAGAQIAALELDGDADRIDAWIGPHRLPITVRAGTPALTTVILSRAAGEIVLDAERL